MSKDRIWRLAEIINTKTNNLCLINVGPDGHLRKSDRKRFKQEFVNEWTFIRASSWAKARAVFSKGDGEKQTRTEDPRSSEKLTQEPPKKSVSAEPKHKIGGTKRKCSQCRKAGTKCWTRSHVRHLHELEAGDRFRFEGQRSIYELESVSVSRGSIREEGGRSGITCTPYAQVIPLDG